MYLPINSGHEWSKSQSKWLIGMSFHTQCQHHIALTAIEMAKCLFWLLKLRDSQNNSDWVEGPILQNIVWLGRWTIKQIAPKRTIKELSQTDTNTMTFYWDGTRDSSLLSSRFTVWTVSFVKILILFNAVCFKKNKYFEVLKKILPQMASIFKNFNGWNVLFNFLQSLWYTFSSMFHETLTKMYLTPILFKNSWKINHNIFT